MENLQICCSPDTYSRVKTDKEYMLEVAKGALKEQPGSYSQLIFSQTESSGIASESIENNKTVDDIFIPISDISNDNEPQTCSTDDKLNWHDAPTKLLLSLIEELRPKLGKSIYVKTKGKMYKIISERMANKGYSYSPVQIENKFRGLERCYKKTVLHNRQTGRNKQTCSYESELNRILAEKKGINPEFVLESGDLGGASLSSAFTDDNSDADNSAKDVKSPDSIFKKRPRPGLREEMLNKIDEVAKEKQDFHSKVLEFLKKKDERAQEREERSKRKLELLEMLINKRKE